MNDKNFLRDVPTLFSAPMIRALLAGTKSQTRRIIKKLPTDAQNVRLLGPLLKWEAKPGAGRVSERLDNKYFCARLWVRETWRTWDVGCQEDHADDEDCSEHCNQTYVAYAATPKEGYRPKPDRARIVYLHESSPIESDPRLLGPWRPSIFMPRWACRLQLGVTRVRVQRLLDISEADAIAEGICTVDNSWQNGFVDRYCWPGEEGGDGFETARAAYFAGWDSLHGHRAAMRNPWVWAISFDRLPLA